MKTTHLLAAVLVLGGSTAAWADGPKLTAKTEADRKTIAAIESLKISLNFTDTPLAEVVDFFREVTQVNILLSKGVKEGGEDHQVTLKVDELKAVDALSLIVQMVDLSYKIEDGVLMIITKDETKSDTYLELVDVRDLLFHLRDFKAPEISLKESAGGDSGGLGVATTAAEDTGSTLDDPTVLVDLIKNHTCGTSWNDNPKCSCEIQNGILIVVQTKEGHEQISQLVEKLRQYK